MKGEPKRIFDAFDLDLHQGEKIALIGSNGAGKSTLMKLMTGILKPSAGEVLVGGMCTADVKPENLSSFVSLVCQNPEDMFIKDSIWEDIAFAMKTRNSC